MIYSFIRYRLFGKEKILSNTTYFVFAATAFVVTLVLAFVGKLELLLPSLLILVQMFLGAYVFFKNPRSEVNVSFSLFCLSLALWSFTVTMLQNAQDSVSVVFWGREIYIGPILIVYFFLYFTSVFPRETKPQIAVGKGVLFIPTIIFMIIAQTPLILETASLSPGGPVPKFGIGLLLFAVYFIAYFVYGLFNLTRKYIRSKGNERTQIRYVFLGLFLSFIFGILTNLISPLIGEARLFVFGPYFTLFLIGFTMYAILKHRLMSIEIVIQRSAVYATATTVIMVFYALAVILSETFFRQVMGYSSLIVTAGAALLIAVAYQPLIQGFQNLTDRLFFRRRYDYQKTLRETSHDIASVIQLEELTNLIVKSFIETMKISEISFLLLDKDREHFRSVPLSLPRYKIIEIDTSSPIISWLSLVKDILVKAELEDEIDRQEELEEIGEVRKKSLEEVKDEMDRLGISVWVPIVSKEDMIGIIALGNKLSGDIFTSEDLVLLSTLANQVAVALDNARLYDEVVNMKDYSEEILQSMVSGVLTVDVKGRVVTFNSMAEKITSRKAGEIVGKSCEEVWGKRGTIPSVVEHSLKDRCYVNFESSIASPERGMVPVSFSSTILRDHTGKKMGALLTIQDLSEVKELEGKVRRADKLSALATMAAGMAHEIKNPLSSMKVLSQLLSKKYDDPEFRGKFEEIIPREINRIDRIVESLLSFARATALHFEKAKINDIIEENAKYFEDQAKAAEVKISKSYAELPEVEVDRGQITQVFSNLMLNAIQAMGGGGELKIATMPGKSIEGILQTVKIQISDNGPGIPEDMLKKLFDPFFTTKHGGTGLGLTITHNIVDGHKGYIDVDSQVGKGTMFTVTLPVSQGLL